VDPDPDDEDGTGSLIIGLMQKDRRKLRSKGLNELSIGYAVYKVGIAHNLISATRSKLIHEVETKLK
jgi:hypothetical protein